MYRPQFPGSGGGLGSGGAWINLQTANYLLNNGIVRSNGYGVQSVLNANGGGSGGAVVVQTLYLKGFGTIECHGGKINLTIFHTTGNFMLQHNVTQCMPPL